ncbi:hypothetical protein CEF21_04010 [Bacillus sp. FJAT-42376]|uniref:YfmQ family protein n=1 Tax=Bacillus sp. FJAT-42376 TaxID=2014076 RepID=UPI000F4E7C0C|nr:YfmQ family protein [Bacillus sp. FJAT-42376]AZB41526.1 hypothetical protein CEF21_04010 [Bacillus sp. FJAT-42376]
MATWLIIVLICVSTLKVVLASPPTFVMDWLLAKFALHAKVLEEDTTVTHMGKSLEGEEKIQFIQHFNEAVFFDRYDEYDVPGTNTGIPLVMVTKKGKKKVRLSVYIYSDHVDVFKQSSKKAAAYSLLSESLQNGSITLAGNH